MPVIGLFSGIAGKIRAQTAEWRMGAARREAEERALASARALDADEVGRRADERAAERARAAGNSRGDEA